jgi:hypothetical protein
VNLLPASSSLSSQPNKMWAIGIGMQLLGYLVADTLCSDMPIFNQMLVTRMNGSCKWLSVVEKITTFSVRQSLLSMETVHFQTCFV